jgi:hypothetical protein
MVASLAISKGKKQPKQKALSMEAGSEEKSGTRRKDMTMSQFAHPGYEGGLGGLAEGLHENVCFGCWSCGGAKKCTQHSDDTPIKKTQTMVLCRNWDLDIMRRRYRSEEIQEIFMKRAASLKFDNKRRKFQQVMEQRHQVYRSLDKYLALYNMRAVLVSKTKRWLHSLLDEVRAGRIGGNRPKVKETTRLMRLKRTEQQGKSVARYTTEVFSFLPIGPTTGYSHHERIGQIQFLYTEFDKALKANVELIKAFPTPLPLKLYQPRKRHLTTHRHIPMPVPEYNRDSSGGVYPVNTYIPEDSPASWLEQQSGYFARIVSKLATNQVVNLTPVAGLERIRKTKYCEANTIKLASLGRKPVASMMEIRGLPWEMIGSQIVSTYVPAQYGGFMVMDKSAVSPGVSPEEAQIFIWYHQPVSWASP